MNRLVSRLRLFVGNVCFPVAVSFTFLGVFPVASFYATMELPRIMYEKANRHENDSM